jgi:hypothetical protein
MSESFAVGTKVSFNTNFYGVAELDKGTGVVDRYESCLNPALALATSEVKCDCGSGGTYFVKIDGSDQVAAYIGKELSVK